MRRRMKLLALVMPLLVAGGPDRAVSAAERDEPKRMVLVELFTSQGCDMCPTAEKVLGALAERDRRIVPIAFHVDDFIELDGKSPAMQRFPFVIEPAWNRQNLRLAVFVQDKRTGAVHQSTDLPWRSTPTDATSATATDKAAAKAR